MKYKKFFQKLEELKHHPDFEEFAKYVEELTDLCDELNGDDVFGTEGWEHAIGLDQRKSYASMFEQTNGNTIKTEEKE